MRTRGQEQAPVSHSAAKYGGEDTWSRALLRKLTQRTYTYRSCSRCRLISISRTSIRLEVRLCGSCEVKPAACFLHAELITDHLHILGPLYNVWKAVFVPIPGHLYVIATPVPEKLCTPQGLMAHFTRSPKRCSPLSSPNFSPPVILPTTSWAWHFKTRDTQTKRRV